MNSLEYQLGGLLYMPAFHDQIVEKIEGGSIPYLTSIALCLEDSIQDGVVEQAEAALLSTLRRLQERRLPEDRRPNLFIRVRTPEQLRHLAELYDGVQELVTGWILPKFDLGNAERYIRLVEELRAAHQPPMYIMPILESRMIANPALRVSVLAELKGMLDDVRSCVLNVRVGGNDFSNLYGLRVAVDQTIYDMGVVRDILMDILGVFARDYVVSGPVWNYFGASQEEPWAAGLRKELQLDRLNGFIGKTAIHPSQLPLIHESLQVTAEDYADACEILNWKKGTHGVKKSVGGDRMNELKCHGVWARRVKILGDFYGVRER